MIVELSLLLGSDETRVRPTLKLSNSMTVSRIKFGFEIENSLIESSIKKETLKFKPSTSGRVPTTDPK